jgi:hypothetical protein
MLKDANRRRFDLVMAWSIGVGWLFPGPALSGRNQTPKSILTHRFPTL